MSTYVIGQFGRQNNDPHPKDTHFLIPRPYEYVILSGERNFADEIKLRILRQGDFPIGPRKERKWVVP